jgi:hypothetical protein
MQASAARGHAHCGALGMEAKKRTAGCSPEACLDPSPGTFRLSGPRSTKIRALLVFPIRSRVRVITVLRKP